MGVSKKQRGARARSPLGFHPMTNHLDDGNMTPVRVAMGCGFYGFLP